MNDPLTVAKLQSFSFLAGVLQLFLKSYQTDEPMALFLYWHILTTLTDITDISKAWSVYKLQGFQWSNEIGSRQNIFMKLIWILGFQPIQQLPNSKEQIRSTMLRFHLFTMEILNKFMRTKLLNQFVQVNWIFAVF